MFSGSFMLYLHGGAKARESDQDFRIPCRMSRQRRSQKAAGRRFTGRSVNPKRPLAEIILLEIPEFSCGSFRKLR